MREERCPAPTEEGARNYATVLRYENRQPLAVFKVRLCGCTMVYATSSPMPTPRNSATFTASSKNHGRVPASLA